MRLYHLRVKRKKSPKDLAKRVLSPASPQQRFAPCLSRRQRNFDQVSVSRIKRSHCFDNLEKGRTYSFQVRAANLEGNGPWSEPSQPVRTLTQRPSAPRAPAVSVGHPPPGPLSLWLSLFLPDEDGGDPVTAMLLETRRHGGTMPPEWSRCDRHQVPSAATDNAKRKAMGKEEPRNGSATTIATSPDSSGDRPHGGHHGLRRGGDGRGPGVGGFPAAARTAKPCCEVVVLVDGLTPRTYYSFRASAVNARGTGDPSPPCRRVRTAAPRPPSWCQQDGVTVNPKQAASPTDSERGGGGGGGGAPPRAECSGLGACNVHWDEPFSNGAAVELYEVEVVRLGPEVEGMVVAGADNSSVDTDVDGDGGDCKSGNDDVRVEEVAAASAAAAVAGAAVDPNQHKSALDTVEKDSVVECGEKVQQSRDLSTLSAIVLGKKKTKEADEIGEAAPPPPPPVVVLPAPERVGPGGRGEVVREVMQRFTRSVPSHMRYVVIRGLATGGDYVFRVAASNVAGMGVAGSWTKIVRVVDPADED